MMATVRVHIVDPTANTPPYDHALSSALAGAGADVELVTSRFVHGPRPPANGYRRDDYFYRLSTRLTGSVPARRAVRLTEHVPDMVRYRRRAREADMVHFQWIAFGWLDRYLLPRGPKVLTVHNVDPRRLPLGAFRVEEGLAGQMDALVVHSTHGADELAEQLSFPRERIHVIPHGAFDYLTDLPGERPLSKELEAVDKPVVLFFGLLRDYKGVEVLLEAFAAVEADAELWVVGENWLDRAELDRLAARSRNRVRFVDRWITDPEIPAYFRRADLVVLPFRQAAPSGVLHTALAFGKPLVLSRLGGFIDVGEQHDAARLVPPEDSRALAAAIDELLADPAERERLAAAAARAGREAYSWDAVAERTLALYQELL
jgi:glycosyltransferase involved in cell wall biosynthesis